MTEVIVIAVVAVIVGGALAYIIRAKRRGVRCIGCSSGGCCGHCAAPGGGGCCGCGCGSPEQQAEDK